MKKETAELIYWALASHIAFGTLFDQDSDNYEEVKKARVRISKRYGELRGSHGFSEADKIARIEWLESVDV